MARVMVIGNLADSLINFRKPFLQALVGAGHKVVACAPPATPEIERKVVSLGVSFCALPMSRAGLNPFSDLVFLFRLVRLIQRYAPEVVVTYTIKPNVYGGIAARIAGTPRRFALITGLGYAFTQGAGAKRKIVKGAVEFLYKRAFANIDAVIFQNSDDRLLFAQRRLNSESTATFVVNGSGVDIDSFAQHGFSSGRIRFLMIARLLKDKGVIEFCEAARLVKNEFPSTEFVLAGPVDPNPSAIPADFVQKWEFDGTGRYLGEIEDVRPLLADSAIYVLPSYREGTPRTVLEAMATGRAVITTDAPGCKETVVEGFNGKKVPVGDIAALAVAMRYFIENPAEIERMGNNGRALATEKYDAHKVAATMMELMQL